MTNWKNLSDEDIKIIVGKAKQTDYILAEWRKIREASTLRELYACPYCGAVFEYTLNWNYCPICGKKIKTKEEE